MKGGKQGEMKEGKWRGNRGKLWNERGGGGGL